MVKIEQDLLPPRYRDPVWVAAGGMGDVYRALDEELDRPVAVKLLSSRFAGDEAVRGRFRREALAAARLAGEPNTVTIFDVGEWHGTPFIVMEFLDGETLEQVLQRGAQAPRTVFEWLEQAARSLDAAHSRGVIHRDVKPANLLLGEDGRVRVGDFGIATAAGLDSLTLTGTVLGTAGYLAPEQAQGRTASAATDCYALAVVAFELLTGTRPFQRDSATAEAAAHAYEPIPAASHRNPSLPGAVDIVFATALAKDPLTRFPTCLAFVTSLRDAFTPEGTATWPVAAPVADPPTRIIRPPRRRRSRLVVALVALPLLAAAALAGALVASRGTSHPQAASTRTTTVIQTTTVAPASSSAPSTTAPKTSTSTRASNPGRGSESASDLNTRGYRLMLAGDYTAALPLLRQAASGLHDPTNPVTAYANFNLGQTLVKLGQCDAALPYLERAAQLEPSRGEVRSAIRYAEQCATGPAPPAGPGRTPPGHDPAHHHGNGSGNED